VGLVRQRLFPIGFLFLSISPRFWIGQVPGAEARIGAWASDIHVEERLCLKFFANLRIKSEISVGWQAREVSPVMLSDPPSGGHWQKDQYLSRNIIR
jgi:hypothetical protein